MADLFGTVASTVVVVQAKGREASGIGSGVLISSDGKIMTAAHLVHGAEEVVVKFLGGRSVEAHVIASELAADPSFSSTRSQPACGPQSWPTPIRSEWVIRLSWWVRPTD
jgi:S1-C subfamily serine protease